MPYAVVNKRNGKVGIRSPLQGALAIYRTRADAAADCMPYQMVREVTIRVLRTAKRKEGQ